MIQTQLKKFDLKDLRKLATALKRGRDINQRVLDLIDRKITGPKGKTEVKKQLRFYERSLNSVEKAIARKASKLPATRGRGGRYR